MPNQTKTCQNCKQDFTIFPDDFSFYEKIKVPPPTFCPECRMIRRLAWRNNRSLYKRVCFICEKTLISMYSDDGAPVLCTECYIGDGWDPYLTARDIDWNKDFFSQVYEIFKTQPRIFQYRIGTVINSDYGNSIVNTKDAYLAYSIIDSENIMYSESVDKSRDSMDSFIAHEIDQCSWNISSDKNYVSHFLVNSRSNIDSLFLFDCTNCQHCCLSSNLRNQSYVFQNEKMSKEEYEQKVSTLKLDTISGFENTKILFKKIMEQGIHRYAQIYSSVNATGNFISNVKNVGASFDVQNSEEVKYSARMITTKDCMDCYAVLAGELEYETMSGTSNSSSQIGCMYCFTSTELEYSMFCRNSSSCFGCIGLKNAKYCILNKQYTKEAYEEIVPRLRVHMNDMPYIDTKERIFTYGEFFPYNFSPFSYGETLAQCYFPLTQKETESMGYNWAPRQERNYPSLVAGNMLPDSIHDVTDGILNETIGCIHAGNCMHQCTEAFRIVPRELQFLKSKNLPLPQKCPNCRHYERLALSTPYKLWSRECSNGCGNIFETTYAPDRPEKVYCEKCYQQEVL